MCDLTVMSPREEAECGLLEFIVVLFCFQVNTVLSAVWKKVFCISTPCLHYVFPIGFIYVPHTSLIHSPYLLHMNFIHG